MATQLRRDSFGRRTLMRAAVSYREDQSCMWCGKKADKTHALYEYWWESDRLTPQPRFSRRIEMFCSIGCWETYNS